MDSTANPSKGRTSFFEGTVQTVFMEQTLRSYWERNRFYHSTPNARKLPYTIVMPPPNVTGELHLGHMLNNTLQDILIRWNRALGKEVCWIPGTDHASIATEARVTALLKEKGIDKKQIGREEFLKHAWEWKHKYGGKILEAWKRLGISVDWEREVFTLDEMYSNNVIKAFVKLYDEGLIYRGHRLVNWCPVSQSVISDEEVNYEERQGALWYIRYPLVENPGEFIVVATTRPETLFGDLAVAVHPDDERFKHLKGKHARVPLCGREIPIVFDAYCDPAKGSGAVKITPAHDLNDFEVGKRHQLGLLNIMNPDASLNSNVTREYIGLDRFVARKKLIVELEQQGLLEKTEPYHLVVGISERGHVPIEYFLSNQWYIKMESLAKKALDATRTGRLQLFPPHTEKTWEHWLTNIKDWCVSRQLWWGHRIPVYTCAKCEAVHCAEKQPLRCSSCDSTDLVQDSDVLDTWASSWLWPFAVHNWAAPSAIQKSDLDYYYPTDCVVTGTEIIFFWIARMVMAGEHFTQKVPFKQVYFTPIVRDAKGRKMSKSLGNYPDTEALMVKYGTDALRFSLINQIVPGQDILWADNSCEIGRTFTNKIWNVTKFLISHAERLKIEPSSYGFQTLLLQPADPLLSWIVSEFFNCVQKLHTALEKFEFAQYSAALYEFIWMIYCDWFIELIKPRLTDEDILANKESAVQVLQVALQIHDGILRLLHPLMPYITEHIWQGLAEQRQGKTLGFESLPLPRAEMIDDHAIKAMREVQDFVSAVRAVRGQLTIHPGIVLKVTLDTDFERFGNLLPLMNFLAKSEFNFSKNPPTFYAPALVKDSKMYVDLNEVSEPQSEKQRLEKRMQKLLSNVVVGKKKLENSEFVKGAPAHILEGAKEQLRLSQLELDLIRIALEQPWAKI